VNTRSNETETEVQRRITCMWHVGLHYLLPFSQLTVEDHRRLVLSQEAVAGITTLYTCYVTAGNALRLNILASYSI